jgi:RNA polymerase sigma-70 factor (ECF subfamily)
MIYAAGRGESVPEREALSSLCGAYWYPLYALVRRRGHSAQDALDLTQGFFARLLEKRDFGGADAERGRFRAYLSGAMLNYIRNRKREENTQKRGGEAHVLSLDHEAAEDRYRIEATDERTPESLYDRAWALVLIERAMTALSESYRASGKGALFEALQNTLTGDDARSYAELASELDMKEGAIKVAVHRLRKRFRSELQNEIASTVSDPEEVQAELDELFDALGG